MRPLCIASVETSEGSERGAQIAILPLGIECRLNEDRQVVAFLPGKARILKEEVKLAPGFAIKLSVFRLKRPLSAGAGSGQHRRKRKGVSNYGDDDRHPFAHVVNGHRRPPKP